MISQENGDDRRRCFASTQTVVVSCTGSRHPQQIRIQVHSADKGAQHQQKQQIALGIFARSQQIFPCVGTKRVVVVLARTVDACKRFFMQQTGKPMLFAQGAHRFHNQLVVVTGNVGSGILRCQLMLGRRRFVVLGFATDAHLPQIFVQILHEFPDANAQTSAVVVVQLLTFRGFCTKQSPSADF